MKISGKGEGGRGKIGSIRGRDRPRCATKWHLSGPCRKNSRDKTVGSCVWCVLPSSQGYALPTGDTLEPDAAYISNARWSAGPRARRGKFLRIVPALVVEILSKGTALRDRSEKKAVLEERRARVLDRRRAIARGDRDGRPRLEEGAPVLGARAAPVHHSVARGVPPRPPAPASRQQH